MNADIFDKLLGKTIWRIDLRTDDDSEIYMLNLHLDDLTVYSMYDEEYQTGNDVAVRLIDTEGDLNALVGEPLVVAERVNGETKDTEDGTSTWTFYRFATAHNFVTLRWCGRSNGYYSETTAMSHTDDTVNQDNPEYQHFIAQRQKKVLLQETNEPQGGLKSSRKM